MQWCIMSYGALDVHQGESPETPQYSCYFHTMFNTFVMSTCLNSK